MKLNNFFANILFSFIAIIINFWFKSYLAQTFGKIELGIYYTLIDIISIFMIIFVGARASMVVEFAKTKNDLLILNAFRVGLFIAFCIASIFLILFYGKIFDMTLSPVLIVLFVLSQAFYIYFFNQLGMRKLYNLTNFITIFEPISIISSFFIIKYLMGISFEQLIISTIFDMLILALIMKLANNSTEPMLNLSVLKQDEAKTFIKNSLLASLEFFAGMLSVYFAVLFFAKYFSTDKLADFQVIIKTIYFYFLTIFVFPIFKFIFPEVTSFVAKKDFNAVQNITKQIFIYSFFVAIFSIILIYLYGDLMILEFFGSNYLGASSLLKITSISFLFVILGGYFTSTLKSFGLFKKTLLIRLTGLISFVVSFYILNFIHSSPANVIYAFVFGHFIIFSNLFFVYIRFMKHNFKNRPFP